MKGYRGGWKTGVCPDNRWLLFFFFFLFCEDLQKLPPSSNWRFELIIILIMIMATA